MAKLKIGVIGTGHLGKIHTKLWSENEHAELAGIYDINRNRAVEIAGEFNCPHFDSLEEIIKQVDAITIAAPTSNHYEIAVFCIENKKHCLIEKPITSTYEQAVRLIEKAKENNVLIQVGHVERFNPAIAAIHDYDLNPKFIEAHRLSQFKPRATDVSVVHDLMIHDIDILLWLVKSKVKTIDANGVNVLTDTTDIANARITFDNGAVANLTASRISAHPMRKMRLFQKDTYLSIDFGVPEVEVYKIHDAEESPKSGIPATMLGTIEAGVRNKSIYFQKPEIPKLNAIAEEQNAFAKAVMDGSPIPVRAEEAAEALRVAEIISDLVMPE